MPLTYAYTGTELKIQDRGCHFVKTKFVYGSSKER